MSNQPSNLSSTLYFNALISEFVYLPIVEKKNTSNNQINLRGT